MDIAPICPYCGQFSKAVNGQAIYPHRKDLVKLKFYQCYPCNAYVGTHKGTGQALGTLANAKLRLLRSYAHDAFDPIWKERCMTRKEAYKWLAHELDISRSDCHIAMFDESTCREVVKIVAGYWSKK